MKCWGKRNEMDQQGITMSIAEVIREERKKAGMTQKELGKRLGVTQSMVAQYECGNRIPKILTIRRIADILEADLEPFYYAYHYAGKIAYAALREKIQRDKGCERCRAKYTEQYFILTLYLAGKGKGLHSALTAAGN